MKFLICLFALFAVALARPQNLPFIQEGLQIGGRINFLAPHEQIYETGVVQRVNELENVPFHQNVDIQRFLIGLEEPVAANVQRSVIAALS